MSNLSNEQINALRGVMQSREKELREDLQRESDEQDTQMDIASEVADPGDNSFASLSIDLSNAAISRDVTELRAIAAAYERMEDGSYGECLQCGVEIPYERLEAQPTAERCAPCQEMYEKTHGDTVRRNTM